MGNVSLRALAALALGAMVGGAAAYFVLHPSAAPATAAIHPVWSEAKWAFPIDQWGTGKAYRCGAGDCGTDVDLYLRAKIGFCNCTTGVADDEELERVADLDLLGEHRSALAPGRPIVVRWMKGRSRPYGFSGSPAEGKQTYTIAFNDHCDAIVATVVAKRERPDLESIALDFLNGDTVIHWAESALGLWPREMDRLSELSSAIPKFESCPGSFRGAERRMRAGQRARNPT